MSEFKILDHGYVKVIESWGSDARIIEAARMSTDKGFLGWGPLGCADCGGSGGIVDGVAGACSTCKGNGEVSGDEKLLRYLYEHKHATPFEFGGMVIEVQAPIFVFREWHRHRTQSYNEMSSRYVPLPDVNYLPSRDRIVDGARSTKNRQASGVKPLATEAIDDWRMAVSAAYDALERTYQLGLELGVPKELARVVLPVGRYSRMRASANLRNWLAFLTLRAAPDAQAEIRAYAVVVSALVRERFPRTHQLFAGD